MNKAHSARFELWCPDKSTNFEPSCTEQLLFSLQVTEVGCVFTGGLGGMKILTLICTTFENIFSIFLDTFVIFSVVYLFFIKAGWTLFVLSVIFEPLHLTKVGSRQFFCFCCFHKTLYMVACHLVNTFSCVAWSCGCLSRSALYNLVLLISPGFLL